MSERTKEQIYDEDIAPILLQAGKIALEHEIDLLAAVDISSEENPYAVGETTCYSNKTAHCAMRLIKASILAKGNVDAMMMAIVKDQKNKPHNSIVIKVLENIGS